MYKLYYLPGTCAMAVNVILNELGTEYSMENVAVPAGQSRSPEFLKLNPRGQVPVLVEGDIVIREGAAIITYLLDKHKSSLLPESGAERAKALEWLAFANATLHPAYGRCFFIMRNVEDKAAKDQVFKVAYDAINKLWAEVDEVLANNTYIAGEHITAADILLCVIANWGITTFPERVKLGDNVKRMIKEVTSRPTYQKAIEDEQVDYKAMA